MQSGFEWSYIKSSLPIHPAFNCSAVIRLDQCHAHSSILFFLRRYSPKQQWQETRPRISAGSWQDVTYHHDIIRNRWSTPSWPCREQLNSNQHQPQQNYHKTALKTQWQLTTMTSTEASEKRADAPLSHHISDSDLTIPGKRTEGFLDNKTWRWHLQDELES